MLRDSIFMFQVQTDAQSAFGYDAASSFGDYEIVYTKQTPVNRAWQDGRELLILGLAVDVRNGQWANLADAVLSCTRTLQDVIAYEAYLGGKYILFYKDAYGTYAIPDATASIPFCYTIKGYPLSCATDSETIAKKLSFVPDAELLQIRNCGDLSQAMPYDLTVYKEVLHLLPNHYFSFRDQRAVRFVNFENKKDIVSPKHAAEITAPYIKNLLCYYQEHFSLQCALTSGWDSRVVLAMMLSVDNNVATYTIRHNNFSETEPDIVIPKEISKKFSITNVQIPDLETSIEMSRAYCEWFGATGYSPRTLMIANTIKSSYGNCAVINGDIIGQVGKCSLHRDVSEKFATAKYFRCKLHNYSSSTVAHLNRWIADIKASGEQVNLFDLFSIESRMGRWAAQENLIYAMVGQLYLNIFNSRAIIYPWTLVPRADRKLSCIHQELIARCYPQLIQIPVGGRPSLTEQITKMNGLTTGNCVYPSKYLATLQRKGFDPIRDYPEFQKLCERVKALIVTR